MSRIFTSDGYDILDDGQHMMKTVLTVYKYDSFVAITSVCYTRLK